MKKVVYTVYHQSDAFAVMRPGSAELAPAATAQPGIIILYLKSFSKPWETCKGHWQPEHYLSHLKPLRRMLICGNLERILHFTCRGPSCVIYLVFDLGTFGPVSSHWSPAIHSPDSNTEGCFRFIQTAHNVTALATGLGIPGSARSTRCEVKLAEVGQHLAIRAQHKSVSASARQRCIP